MTDAPKRSRVVGLQNNTNFVLALAGESAGGEEGCKWGGGMWCWGERLNCAAEPGCCPAILIYAPMSVPVCVPVHVLASVRACP